MGYIMRNGEAYGGMVSPTVLIATLGANNIPKHTFINKVDYEALDENDKSEKFYNIMDENKNIIGSNSMYMHSIANNLTSTLTFKGSCNNINELPSPQLTDDGTIYIVGNETYVCSNRRWEQIGYNDSKYDNTPKMVPKTNCCNCGAPLHNNSKCEYCGTYN